MKSHLRAGLIALASLPIALAPTGFAAAAAAPGQTLSVSPSPSPSPSPAPSAAGSPSPSKAAPASSPTNANLAAPPRTNLTAVVDPIAVPVHGGFLIRVGVRNSGPLSITAPAGEPAAKLSLAIDWCCLRYDLIKSLGGCAVGWYFPPNWPTFPEEPRRYDCSYSKRTLRVGNTYWESFVFPDLSGLADRFSVTVSGYADDPQESDNRRNLVVHPAAPGSTLPVTGASTVSVAGAGLAMVVAGTMAIWYGRRRRLIQPAGSAN